ncbi:uncharacterized protein EV154DRAFT_489099 [Mucor mucedo]|uniref:uncharacterized protein n=1 Tax=Mucor mucedo TaxID=29922 RepID=UPI00221ED157|nr:uncharacterized protein EV154DRAFT_489099 [Mucor mucedo]KAI7863202.1 hypothetical protein EV154DRAFT_489099 [Mucor mucedo]
MTFSEFVQKCSAATTLTDRLALMFNGVTYTRENCSDPTICEINIDAFISHASKVVPIKPKTRVKLFLSPHWGTALNRLEFGSFTFCGDKDYIKNYPHTLLFELSSEALMKIHIVFPNMKQKNLGMQGRKRILSAGCQRKFTDKLLLPALKRLLSNSAYNRSGATYGQSIGTGFHATIPRFLFGSDVPVLVHHMREIARESLELAQFRHFVFVCSSFGFKCPIYGDDHLSILDTMLDWSLLDASKCLIDIGINFYAESKLGSHAITFVKAEHCYSLGSLFAGSSAKTKLMNMTLGTFGGIKAVSASPASRYASKVLIYNDIKYPFTLGNVGYNGSICGEWNAEEMRKKFRHYTGRHLFGMEIKYGFRIIYVTR